MLVDCSGIMSLQNRDGYEKFGDLFKIEKGNLPSKKNKEGPYSFITAGKL